MGHDVFADAASGACAELLTGYQIASIPSESTVVNLLAKAPDCIKDVLTIAARNEIAQGDDMDPATVTKLSSAVTNLENVIDVGQWATIENDLEDVLDYAVDQKDAAVPGLGFGFSILARYSYTGTGPASTPATVPGSASTPAIGPAPAPTSTPTPQPGPTETSAAASPSQNSQPVTVYDNYGTAINGYPVCRGNPARAESMPGGTVTQKLHRAVWDHSAHRGARPSRSRQHRHRAGQPVSERNPARRYQRHRIWRHHVQLRHCAGEPRRLSDADTDHGCHLRQDHYRLQRICCSRPVHHQRQLP